MLEILLYILATETAGLVSKFDNSQYKKGGKINNKHEKRESNGCTIHNVHQIKAIQWLRKNISISKKISRNPPGVSHSLLCTGYRVISSTTPLKKNQLYAESGLSLLKLC